MIQFPFPPPPMPTDPPGPLFQLLSCIVFVLLWFEGIVFILPEHLRRKVSELQFGPWNAKRKD